MEKIINISAVTSFILMMSSQKLLETNYIIGICFNVVMLFVFVLCIYAKVNK